MEQTNPYIVFYDCAFDIKEMYPDETLVAARNKYFEEVKKRIEDEYLEYSEKRAFQNELLRTLTLVFKHDFKEYLSPESDVAK